MNQPLSRRIAHFVLVALATFLAMAPARAVIYVGSWDPTYGGSFPGLGWRGTATFDIPGNCGATASFSGLLNNSVDCGGSAVVRNAQVDFYDTANPSITVGSASWASPGPNIAIPGVVVGDLQFFNGDLVQLTTNLFPFATPLPANSLYGPSDFALQFVINENVNPNPGGSTLFSGPLLYDGFCFPVGSGVICQTVGRNDAFDFPPDFVITRIPEPSALVLLAGALLAAGASVRRRSVATIKQ
jgi:hypothetical protein